MTVAVILLAIAVLILAGAQWPAPTAWAAFILALIALLMVATGWRL